MMRSTPWPRVRSRTRSTSGSSATASGLPARGATDATEFARQTDKLVNVVAALDADILGLNELENNFTPGAAGNALEHLVNALNAKLGAGTYVLQVGKRKFARVTLS